MIGRRRTGIVVVTALLAAARVFTQGPPGQGPQGPPRPARLAAARAKADATRTQAPARTPQGGGRR